MFAELQEEGLLKVTQHAAVKDDTEVRKFVHTHKQVCTGVNLVYIFKNARLFFKNFFFCVKFCGMLLAELYEHS